MRAATSASTAIRTSARRLSSPCSLRTGWSEARSPAQSPTVGRADRGARKLCPAARPDPCGGCVRRRRRAAGQGRRHPPAGAARARGGQGRHRGVHRRGAGREPGDAGRAGAGGLRAHARVGERRDRGAPGHRRDRPVSRSCRPARPPGGHRFARPVLHAVRCRGDRRVGAARLDRRRAVPQHRRGRFHRRRLPRQRERRACVGRARLRVDRRRPGPGRARGDRAARGARRRGRRGRAATGRASPVRDLGRVSPRLVRRAASGRSGCSRSCALTEDD